jgi:hypothetical protein
MHPATPTADQAIVAAVDELNRYSAELTRLRNGLGKLRLPIAAAEDRLDNLDDVLAIAASQLNLASQRMEADFERILKADDARYVDDYATENERVANDNHEPPDAPESIEAREIAFARAHGLTALAAKLAGDAA